MRLISYVLRDIGDILWGSHIRTFELTRSLGAILIQGTKSRRLLNIGKEMHMLLRSDAILIFGYRALFYDSIMFDILHRRKCNLFFDMADIPHLQPVFFGVDGSKEKQRIMQENFNELLDTSDTLLSISPSLVSLLNMDDLAKRTVFVPNAANPKFFKKTPMPKAEKKMILYVGGYAPMRGLELLVEAFGLLYSKRKDLMLKLVGPNIPANMQKDGIVIERSTYYPEMPDTYSGSYVCVIPHMKNPYMDAALPIKLFDAMASARPVISTNCYEAGKLVEDEKCGLVTECASRSLAESIDYLLDNQAIAEEMGERGREAVEKRHSWDHRAQAIIEQIQ